MTEASRKLGEELGKAYGQIERSADLIRRRAPGFQYLPTDRPMHGLVLTMEPFELANSPLMQPRLLPNGTFTSVVSAWELEWLVCMEPVSQMLSEREADPQLRTYSLRSIFRTQNATSNRVLDEAW
ncbi:hypothetical protein [Streptomyces sp. CA-132043]|uniref:hypothetical protein n=1 Tax=Streptomyces sp. CA-132043 TaxID=3240048 RepID=UPI003D90D9C0